MILCMMAQPGDEVIAKAVVVWDEIKITNPLNSQRFTGRISFNGGEGGAKP